MCPPKPTIAKTYQIGSVLKLNRWTLDVDAYYVHFQNVFDSYIDPTTNENVFVATGPSNTRGVEMELTLPTSLANRANGKMSDSPLCLDGDKHLPYYNEAQWTDGLKIASVRCEGTRGDRRAKPCFKCFRRAA